MSIEFRHLRCLDAIVSTGSFTDAAIELGMSQAAVSRNLAALEENLGVRLLNRTTRAIELTPTGDRVLRHARRALATLDDLERDARAKGNSIRIGYAWSALGRHTIEFQRRWAQEHPFVALTLARTNTATAGLAEGTSDLAILRQAPGLDAIDVVLVGIEKRYCALAATDTLAQSRSVTLASVAQAPVAIDSRTGSTALELWAEGERPARVLDIHDIDDWLVAIGSGIARGMTAEATVHQYRRPGIVYRPVRDAPPVPVYLAWLRSDPPRERDAVIEMLVGLYS